MTKAAAGRRISRFRTQATILLAILALMWLLEIVDLVILDGRLNLLGIRPRSISGLWGILIAPFLHGGLGHLLANSIPFLVLGWLVMLRRTADFFVVSGISILTAGLAVWLFGGANTIHLGASSLIFGYLGFLLLRGFFERSIPSIVLAIVVGVLYGGALWGVLPLQRGVSWEGHLFGFAGGVVAARLLSDSRRPSFG